MLYADVTNLQDVQEVVKSTADSAGSTDSSGKIDIVIDFAGVHHPPFDFYYA